MPKINAFTIDSMLPPRERRQSQTVVVRDGPPKDSYYLSVLTPQVSACDKTK